MDAREDYPWVLHGANLWPTRRGCRARIVPHPPAGDPRRRQYPWKGGKLKEMQVVIKILDDPLADPWAGREEWSCVVDRRNLRWDGPGELPTP